MAIVPTLKAVVVLDNDGARVCAKYYDSRLSTKEKQALFESKLHKKTKGTSAKMEAEVMMLDGMISVFRAGSDLMFYVVGDDTENEILLGQALEAFYTALSTIVRGHMDRRTILDCLDSVLLTIDELTDSGHLLELDHTTLVHRVMMKGSSAQAASSTSEWVSFADRAKDTLFKAFSK